MNVRQTYFDFLQSQGAREKIQSIIAESISRWRQVQAYYYEPDDNDPGDYSGHCHMNADKTIGDIATTDMDVLKAYTGDSQATYTSGCGLLWLRVADRVSEGINDCLTSFRGEFINENADALLEEYDIKREADWDDDDTCLAIFEAMALNDYGMNYDWMRLEFPEYELDDETMPSMDYIFNISE